jgi:hypothetical protein
MNRKIVAIIVGLMTIAMLALPMSMVYAKNEKNDKFIAVSGSFSFLYDSENEFKEPDDNYFWSQSDCTTFWTGGIGGDSPGTQATCDFTMIFIKPVWLYVPELGTVTIVDYQRNVVQEVHTLTDPIIDGTPYSGELTIGGDNDYWRILGGTEDLANVHGQGTKYGTDPFTVEYEGWIHFGP